MSMSATYCRSLLAVVGVTAGLASAVGPWAAPVQAGGQADSGAKPPEVFKGPAPASAPTLDAVGTCFSWTNVKGFVGSVPTSINVPTTGRENNVRDCLLQQGNQTDGVFKVQNAINVCYPQFSSGVGFDGNYAGNTTRAVSQIQFVSGVTVDGVYGADTKTAMRWPAYRQSDGSFYGCVLLRS